tara:strand:+ start:2396 stop:2659 length:264 start_codon:yes stop_codon:yes gene_type:complete
MKFKDLKFEDVSETHGENAIQAWVDFPNGYSASVIRHMGSYGNKEGLYEIGAFYGERMATIDRWHDQVKGWLDESGVEKELDYLRNY